MEKTKRQNEGLHRQYQLSKRAEKPDAFQSENKKLQAENSFNLAKIEEFRENFVKLQAVITDLNQQKEKGALPDSEMKVERPVVDFAAIQKKLSDDHHATNQKLTEAESQLK